MSAPQDTSDKSASLSTPVTPGTLVFGPIPQLPSAWWDSPDDESVWPVWDPNTYYLWGANAGNWDRTTRGEIIGGGGLAGDRGPTCGRGHPHYLGANTMTYDRALAATIFDHIGSLIMAGHDIVVPTYKSRWSLGTGIGAGVRRWGDIQCDLFERIYALAKKAAGWSAPADCYWPDLRPTSDGARHLISGPNDLAKIAALLN